jgi:hypothetical protein
MSDSGLFKCALSTAWLRQEDNREWQIGKNTEEGVHGLF